jgi:hypothetical protein
MSLTRSNDAEERGRGLHPVRRNRFGFADPSHSSSALNVLNASASFHGLHTFADSPAVRAAQSTFSAQVIEITSFNPFYPHGTAPRSTSFQRKIPAIPPIPANSTWSVSLKPRLHPGFYSQVTAITLFNLFYPRAIANFSLALRLTHFR